MTAGPRTTQTSDQRVGGSSPSGRALGLGVIPCLTGITLNFVLLVLSHGELVAYCYP